jgi:hypothetical protein
MNSIVLNNHSFNKYLYHLMHSCDSSCDHVLRCLVGLQQKSKEALLNNKVNLKSVFAGRFITLLIYFSNLISYHSSNLISRHRSNIRRLHSSCNKFIISNNHLFVQ